MSTPTTSSTDIELRNKIQAIGGYRVKKIKGVSFPEPVISKMQMDEIMAAVRQDREARERTTLETVAAMTGGGSSAQEALDTIKFYAHNKLFAINNPIPDSKAKA